MTYTRKQAVTCISLVYLIGITALAGYAACRANDLSIPIPSTLRGFATALPIVAGLLLEAGYDLTRVQERHRRLPRGDTTRPPLVIVANTIIFIYSSVVITLLGTHAAPPSGLNCGLDSRWKTLFQLKNDKAIRTIQDTFNCCGFVNSHDRAWPFPDRSHDARACENAFGRTSGCMPAWKAEEQRVAGILMTVVGLVFLWQFTIIVIPTQRESWLHRVVPDRVSRIIADEEHGSSGPRRAIDYLPNFNRYSDNGPEEVSDEDLGRTSQSPIQGGVQRIKDAVNGGNDEEEQHLSVDNAWARN